MRRFIVTISILIFSIILCNLPSSPAPTLKRMPLSEFPPKIGDWVLQQQGQMDNASLAVLQVDDYIIRSYANSQGQVVSLYIGFFNTQREGKTNHSPRQCLPGAGWTPSETSTFELNVSDSGTRYFPANRFLMQKGNEQQLFLFWYQGRGRQIANEYMVKAYLMWDSIVHNRTDGALIRVNTNASANADQAFKNEVTFIRAFYPLLSKFIPE